MQIVQADQAPPGSLAHDSFQWGPLDLGDLLILELPLELNDKEALRVQDGEAHDPGSDTV